MALDRARGDEANHVSPLIALRGNKAAPFRRHPPRQGRAAPLPRSEKGGGREAGRPADSQRREPQVEANSDARPRHAARRAAGVR